ncbi:MAG TPA: stage II sporulation protein M [Natronosporangium sp.]|nr:stage II sporulation protein M [Natronosporangium sp.]
MDLDAFVTEHRGEWERLRRLSSRRARRLSPEQVDELVALYQRAATHLSIVRSRSGDPALVAWLSQVVLRGRAALTPSRGFTWAGVVRFLTTSFPGEVWRAAPWWIGVAVAFSTLAGIRMAVVAAAPERYLPPAEIDRIVNEAFEAYYSTYQPQNFAALVWTNNTFVAALCLAAGVLIVPTLLVLWHNLENLGVLGGIMIANDRTDVFFGLLLIHGLLELTAVFVAAGVGLRIGWAWIAPGPYLTRPHAVAQRARSGMVVALGLGLVLLVSGVIEAFVTPAPLPIALRLTIGAMAWLGFLGYVGWCGRRAVHSGQHADVDPLERPATAPVSN